MHGHKNQKKSMNLFYVLPDGSGDVGILPQKTMKSYYHASSHGLEKNDIFKSREDFIAGMNDVAICILGYDVSIVCFSLMSNHFHFLLYGVLSECKRFAEEYKRRCGMRMRASGDVQGLREVELRVDHVGDHEYLENVIAYILRNPLSAGIRMMPYHYPWSSVSLYFNGGVIPVGERLNDMSERKRFRVLRSRLSVPDTYVVNGDGMILPSCYMDPSVVERIFRHPARLMMALARKVENEVEVRSGIADEVSMTDQEVLTHMNELIKAEFNQGSISQLSMEQRLRLCLLLKRNFRAGVRQIARVTRLDPDLVAKVV